MHTVAKQRVVGEQSAGAAGGRRLVACVLGQAARSVEFLSSPVCRLLAGLLVVLVSGAAIALLLLLQPAVAVWLIGAQFVLLSLGTVLVFVVFRRIKGQLLTPLSQLRQWALAMRAGDRGIRMPEPSRGELYELARNINALSDELDRLSSQMDREVGRHTEALASKTRSLQVLYDVAASINIFNDLDDLLTRFLHTLIDVVGARAATVRLLNQDDQMQLVASVGLTDREQERERLVPMDRSMWGTVVSGGDVANPPPGSGAADSDHRLALGAGRLETISVPLRYHGKTVGVYNLFVEPPGLGGKQDVRDLLTSIGRHLGMAIEKVRLDQQAQRLSIMQERNLLAHELHDSLAQTLASLRFQVRMLDDTLRQGDEAQARGELGEIQSGLEEANTELRGLLAHFRAPMDKRGLLPALEDTVARFRRETGIVTFFQKECQQPSLPASLEIHVLRIVQEALTNVRKHSRARAVRILLRCDKAGAYHVMVEDDGIGMPTETLESKPGEHLGLAILRERAERLGSELTIESEPAEGTRIELNFTHPRAP